ncbi:hypothetical protein T5B8_17326 [Salinisphaera sp. T5B8]|uniref:hypothetical protein n=1 Tax=Salinisphaera sp. T5B8 TaxID=1304154 RepID=UPI003342421D
MHSRVKNAGRYGWALTCGVCALALSIAAYADSSVPGNGGEAPQAAGFANVLDAWLGFPDLADSDTPYTYLRADQTADNTRVKRQDLVRELDDLRWRLEAGGYAAFVQALDQWKTQLAAIRVFREPGDWSPAWLMANPHRNPPISRVAAIGACDAPDWVEIWSGQGIERTPWHTDLMLSDLAASGVMDVDGVRVVSVVAPDGRVRRLGQAADNYSDSELLPGTRVVVPLPLKGEAFPWIRDTIAQVLAHAPSGQDCTEMRFAQTGAPQ